jgi:signal transduction histidine kinase
VGVTVRDWRALTPYVVDTALFVTAAAIGGFREVSDPNLGTKLVTAPTWVYVAAQVLAAAALLRRRHNPYGTALVIAAISLFAPATAAFFAPYAVTAYGRGRRAEWAVVGTLAVCFMVGAHAWAIADPFSAPVAIVASAVFGLYVAARRRLILELAEQARVEERVRLAGEMHDVVTHRINLMVLQAGALGARTTDPAARAAADELGEAGRQALAELRDLLGVLRTGGTTGAGPGSGAPVEGLAALVDESRAAGLAVDLSEDGDAARVAPTVRRTLFRVVQESLTNVHKHAPGARVTVDVRYGAESVRASVHNGPPRRPPDAGLAAVGGGTGLPGLRHRVELVGGRFDSGRTPDGGFAVAATLPVYVPTAAR